MIDVENAYGEELRELAAELCRFDTTGGNERPAQEYFRDRLREHGFETYTWTADAEALAAHRSFPSAGELADFSVGERPSVAGVLELGDPDRGRTLVLNGHMDVVPVTPEHWSGDPFEPRWNEGTRLTARGAADMKSQLAACLFAAHCVAEEAGDTVGGDDGSEDGAEENAEEGASDLDGRIVVESVAGEEQGGFGAAAAAMETPYPFERDAAIVAEPTDLRAVTATEGCLMGRVSIEGRSAHAARRWAGESVLPRFERVRRAFRDLETERGERVSHPLYERFETPWPIVIGRVEAGSWASNVPDTLAADVRVGVAPGESIDDIEAECRARLAGIASDDSEDGTSDSDSDGDADTDADAGAAVATGVGEGDAGSGRAIGFERFGIQFASAEIDAEEPIVGSLREAMAAAGLEDTRPTGETYGADARFYTEAGIPSVVFGPGRIEQAHFPDESIRWPDVLLAGEVLAETTRRYLSAGP
ncbi:peptidase M20 [Halobacteriales archaeon QH_8_64_26]|nr:MAG: peptidase M20 [Halobacteriales archaeon QH_8_64_26]